MSTLPLAQPYPRKQLSLRNRLSLKNRFLNLQPVETRPLPLALIHPRKQCRETQFAAIICKAGRNPTAPLAQPHPRKILRTPRRNPALRSIRIRLRAAKVPLALIHPRKQYRETQFAAIIRKAARCPSTPLAPPYPRNPRRTRMHGKIHFRRQHR